MSKKSEKRNKFVENNRKIVNYIGNVFCVFLILSILVRFAVDIIRSLSEIITAERLKLGLISILIIFVSYIIASFLFGSGFEDD